MHYVYLLKHKFKKHIYIGYTEDLRQRLRQHKQERPNYRFVYCEVYLSQQDALDREAKLKNYGSSLGHLKNRISESLERAG